MPAIINSLLPVSILVFPQSERTNPKSQMTQRISITCFCIIMTLMMMMMMLGCHYQHPGGERGAATACLTECCSSRCRNCPQHPQN